MEAVAASGATGDHPPRSPYPLSAPRFPGWLLAVLFAAFAFAAFDGGATSPASAAAVEIVIALALAGVGIAVAARALEPARSRLAWTGVGLLAAFAVWSAVSITWSLAPDGAWITANRVGAYAGATGIALLIAPRIKGAAFAMAGALVLLALALAAYALAGKIAPTLSLGPIDLDHGSEFARLRQPLGYWNALGILLVMAMPVCIWVAGSPGLRRGLRAAALLALQVLIVAAVLTFSRGALVALVVAAAIMFAAGPHRLSRIAALAAGLAFAAPPVIFTFTHETLSSDGVAAAERSGDGALLGLCLAGSLIALAGAARIAFRYEERAIGTPGAARRVRRALVAGTAVSAIAAVGLLAASDRGIGGTITEEWEQFKSPAPAPSDAGRLISTSSSNRYRWWSESIGAFADRPVAGWGAGSFPFVHVLYRDNPGQVASAHSVPLQLLAEGGIVGAGLGLGALAVLGAAAVRRIRRSDGAEHGARLALLAAFAGWSVHSLFDWTWEIPGVALPALAAIAFAAAPPARRERPGALRRVSRRGPAPVPTAALATAVGAVLIASASLPALAESDLKRAERLAAEGGDSLGPALESASRSRRLNPLSVDAMTTTATIYSRFGRLDLAEEVLLSASLRHPRNFRVWSALTRIEGQLGNPAVAVRAYEQSLANNSSLAIFTAGSSSAIAWTLAVPPPASPTAFGTPPPG